MTLKRIKEIKDLLYALQEGHEKLLAISAEKGKYIKKVVAEKEADQKKYNELKEELEYLYESYEVAIEVLDTEHNAVIREIKLKLEAAMGMDGANNYYIASTYWAATWQKYGGE